MKPYNVDREKWQRFPPEVQLQNIATELTRAAHALLLDTPQRRAQARGAYERALALLDASLADPQWKKRERLYELRDAISALYVGEEGPAALSRLISAEIMRNPGT